MLEYYHDDKQIFVISGNNFQQGLMQNKKTGKYNYDFTIYGLIWGWATWKKIWEKFDHLDAKNYIVDNNHKIFENKSLSLSSTPTTFGIISPPFSTNTLSPTRISNFAIWSALCREARLTVVPANCTGSKLATGVIAPVRPT